MERQYIPPEAYHYVSTGQGENSTHPEKEQRREDFSGSDWLNHSLSPVLPVSGYNAKELRQNTGQSRVLTKEEIVEQGVSFESDLSLLETRQQEWNESLGIGSDRYSKIRNYNPVISRVNFEKSSGQQEREQFKQTEVFEIQTMLKERYKAFMSSFELMVDDKGNLRSSLFPRDTYEDILRRGIEYRRQNGSPELEREEKELEGILKIQNLSSNPDTPIGTKYLLFSPPGIVENTTYKKRFVDYGELVEDEQKKRSWKFTRFECGLSDEEYARVAELLEPGFFQDQKGPIDAWYLSKPIFKAPHEMPQTADTIFQTYFKRPEDTLDESDMAEINEECMPLILHLVNLLASDKFQPEKIALTINATLIRGDKKYKQVLARKRGEEKLEEIEIYYMRIEDEVENEGRGYVASVDAGCGESGGYDLSYGNDASQFLFNSVGSFSLYSSSGEKKTLSCTCPFCNQKVAAVIEGGRITCPKPACGKSAPYNC